ncbi:aminoglycoside phosphotransferase [Mangrovimicrobium sediminis]|uniref:Aminoglycoside phosphotransferase n=1 Tax=Mangrovimicrobium sediminis TaxID=2562682 RepID=A0A4Z0M075_9GAMM|nr:aminoglycoside phosphotransferase [Haliea sp. SAOS-164]
MIDWAQAELGWDSPQCSVVAGDASARRYFRLRQGASTCIAVHAPPQTEKNTAFLAMREQLERGGICVPALLAADLERGFLLLGDLGDRLLLAELDTHSVDASYRTAFGVLLQLAALPADDPAWPHYDRALLGEELSRFPEWFAGRLLQRPLDAAEQAMWQALCAELIDSALAQPRVLVHRDFHSRNLMPQADGRLGVIDFQDAVIGPATYDLVSLLRDCYVRWPREQVRGWALEYLEQARATGQFAGVDQAQFLGWFDLMGLQRHLKVLGTFARLYLRDGKLAYLDDLPLVLRYVEEALVGYRDTSPAAAEFADWFAAELRPLIDRQPWSRAA